MLVTFVTPLVKYALGAWLLAVAVVIFYRIFSGGIVTLSLVKVKHTDSFSFHRSQLMVITLLFCAGYIVTAVGRDPDLGMPDISTPLLAALLGSHAAYLGGKLLS